MNENQGQTQNQTDTNNKAQNITAPVSQQQNKNSNVVATSNTDIYTNHQQGLLQSPNLDSQLSADNPGQTKKKSSILFIGTIVLIVLTIGSYFGYLYYQQRQRQEAVKKIVPTTPDASWTAYSTKDEKLSYGMPADFLKFDFASLAASFGISAPNGGDNLIFYSPDKTISILFSEYNSSSESNPLKSKKTKYAQGKISISGENAEVTCPLCINKDDKKDNTDACYYCSVYQVSSGNSFVFMLVINKPTYTSKGLDVFNKFLGSIKYFE